MKVKLGELVRDNLGNVFRVIEETRHWQSPDKFRYSLYQEGRNEGRIVSCSDKGKFHSGYNGHGTKIISVVEEV